MKKEEIMFHAQRLLHYNDLLIAQCDSWLSEEEGNRNMEERIIAKNKKTNQKKLTT
jgi:hypothetical protein